MIYAAYRRQIERAAERTGGNVESLAGGYYGVTMPGAVGLPGARLVFALDLDAPGAPEWCAWLEEQDGEQCWFGPDQYTVTLGIVRPSEYGALRPMALALLGYEHGRQH